MMANRELPDSASRSDSGIAVDLLTKYFLRRLAMTRRNGSYTDRRAQHSNALVEVIIVAIAALTFAVLSFVLILSLR